MATFTKQILSGSTDGKFIAVAGAGTVVHTAHATDQDEVWIYVSNKTAADIDLSVNDGTSTFIVTITANATDLVIPGTVFTNSVVLTLSHGGGDGDLLALGYVNRIG